MATFSDQELLFLSNLMHMKEEIIYDKNNKKVCDSPFKNIWVDEYTSGYVSIGTILSKIDTNALRTNKYLKNHKFDGEISGSEWADMIDVMKQSDICELKIQDVNRDDKNALNTYLTDKEGNAYVVFRGTGAGEWYDNFSGAFEADTEQQKRALDYINSISAQNITVVGHSKGGNKAKYVALLSDKVGRCVSFDGQGFSQAFMEKYQDLIERNQNKINCNALDADYVNILLYDIFNEKNYIKGNGVDIAFEQNHSPNSFFYFTDSADGNLKEYYWNKTNQVESLATLHSFVNYVMCTASEKDKESLFSFLGNLANLIMGGKPPNYTQKYTTEEVLEYLTAEENAEELGLLVAYIIEYEKYDNSISKAIINILDRSGKSDISKVIRKIDGLVGTERILEYILNNHEKIEELLNMFGVSNHWITTFKNISKAYEKRKHTVPTVTPQSIAEYNVYANDVIRDYTQAKREKLLHLTEVVANEKPYDVNKWDVWYRLEDWFGLLNINRYKDNIDTYFKKVIDINGTSNHQMQQIFDNIDNEVRIYKSKMEIQIQNLKALSNNIKNL